MSTRFVALAVFVLVPGLALAQKSAHPDPNVGAAAPRSDAAAPVSLMDLARADVVLESGNTVSEKRAGPAVTNPNEAPTGKVVDLVVSTQDGQLACAALAVGKLLGSDERTVLVPATAFRTAPAGERSVIVLRLTKAELSGLPEFDLKKEGKDGLDRAVERARGLGSAGGANGIRESDKGRGGEKAKESAPGASLSSAPNFVLASQLPECTVSGTDSEFGKVHDASVDPAKNTIGYLIVSRTGGAGSGTTMHAVPFRACKWTSAAGKVDIKLAKPTEQLKSAPEYKKPDQGILTSEQAKAADAFFGGGKPGETEGTRPL
jgi:PRC-barrel domain